MIANGIILAFSELKISLPVVVRIRGTNEREGQRIVRLPINIDRYYANRCDRLMKVVCLYMHLMILKRQLRRQSSWQVRSRTYSSGCTRKPPVYCPHLSLELKHS